MFLKRLPDLIGWLSQSTEAVICPAIPERSRRASLEGCLSSPGSGLLTEHLHTFKTHAATAAAAAADEKMCLENSHLSSDVSVSERDEFDWFYKPVLLTG